MAEIRGETEIGGRWGMSWRRRLPNVPIPSPPNVKLVVQPLVGGHARALWALEGYALAHQRDDPIAGLRAVSTALSSAPPDGVVAGHGEVIRCSELAFFYNHEIR